MYVQKILMSAVALLLLAIGTANASNDPVAANPNTGANFNRYSYANNNPYKFTDPDGRQSRELNWENKNIHKVEPPPRSPDDQLGPIIGIALSAVLAAPVAAEIGLTVFTNPGAVAAATDIAAGAAGVTGTAGVAGLVARALTAEGKALASAQPVGAALKTDLHHNLPTLLRQEAAAFGTHTKLVGGDGTTRTLTQSLGRLNEKTGRFEFIVEGAELTHQRFVSGGSLNGIPNTP